MGMQVAWLRIEARRHWRSLAAIAVLVALATATVLAAVAGARRGDSTFQRLWGRTLPTTVSVLPNQPGFDWSKISALPEVIALTKFAVADAFVVQGNPDANVGFPPADDHFLRTIERPVVLQGRIFNPHRADEVVVTAKFPAQYGEGVGDWLTVRLPSVAQANDGYDPESGGPARGPQTRVRIVGIVRSFWLSDGIDTSAAVQPDVAFFDRYRANIVGTHGQGYINALIRLKGGTAAIPQFRADLARVSGRTDIDVLNNYVDFGESARHVTAYEAACLLAFGLAALIAAIFLVGQSVARYASSTVPDLQVLQAVGLARRPAVISAATPPLLAAVAGATAGVAGALVASIWMPIGGASVLEPSPGLDADWLVLISGWILAPLLVLAGSALATASALRPGRGQGGRSGVAAAAEKGSFPVPVLIGIRFALETGRGRAAVPVRPALIGAVAGVLGVLAASTFSAGVADAAANPARFGQTAQLGNFLGENGRDFGPAGRAMTMIARDRDVTGVNDARVAVAQAGQISVTAFTYTPVGGKRLPVVLIAGRLPAAANEVALASSTAREMHARVGSTVRLTGSSTALPVRVTGVGFVPEGPHNEYSSGAWVTSGGFTRLFRGAHFAFKFRVGLVSLRPGASPAVVANRINHELTAIKAPNFALAPPAPLDQLKEIRDVAALPIVLSGFLALLAIGAIGHALGLAVRRRRHELAVLRALGMTRTQARLVIAVQATVLAVTGVVFGVPLGLIVGRSFWRAVASSTPMAYHPPLAALALVLIAPLTLLVANALAAWPGQRAARTRTAQVLRAE
ncbi:MAG TPA: FtsX-like permease family protein [Streptosporangiaceae bacterium]